jgi:hypothetical protein
VKPLPPLTLTPEERELVLTWRAFQAYATERDRLDRTRDERRDEMVSIELYRDTSGAVHVETEDPGSESRFRVVGFDSITEGAGKIESATMELGDLVEQRQRGRKVGDPRKGRKKRPEMEDCDGLPEEVAHVR